MCGGGAAGVDGVRWSGCGVFRESERGVSLRRSVMWCVTVSAARELQCLLHVLQYKIGSRPLRPTHLIRSARLTKRPYILKAPRLV